MANTLNLEVQASVADAVRNMAKMEAAMNELGIATKDITKIQNELAKASFDAETAFSDLSKAQKALAENTDPEIQRELEGNVLAAQVAVDNQAESVLKLQGQINALDPKVQQAAKNQKLWKDANRAAADALGVFGVSLTSLNSPLTAIATGLKASMEAAIGWSNTVDDVQKITGETAEETSKLVVVMEDFGVSSDSLRGAAKALKDEGLSPNLETLKDLAKQYQSIEDPAERVKWGTEKMGKAFFDLSEVLTKTPEEFEAVERAAQSSGKIIGQDMVDQMEAAQIKAKQLQDQFEGLKIAIGVPLVNTLSAAVDGWGNYTKLAAALNIVMQKNIGLIDEEQAALRANAIATGDLSAVYTEQFSPAITNTTDAVDRQNERLIALNSSVTTATPNVAALSASAERWKGIAAQAEAEKEFKARLDDLTSGMSMYSAVTGQAVDNELKAYQDKQRETGVSLAEVKNELDKLLAVQGKSYTVVTDATVSQAEYELALQKSADAAQALADNTDPDKTLALTVAAEKAAEKANEMADGLGGVSSGIIDNSEKIEELKGKYGDLQAAYAANAEAHNLATRKIILGYLEQQLAADGLSQAEIGYLLDIGEQWGVYGDNTKKIWDATVQTIKDGALDADETMRTLGAQFPSYFTDINRSINYDVHVTGNVPYGAEPGGEAPVNYGAGGNETVPASGGYASGGMAYGPMSGHWELLHGNERVLSPEQTRAYNSGQGGGGGEVAALLRTLPALIARSVRDGIIQAAR